MPSFNINSCASYANEYELTHVQVGSEPVEIFPRLTYVATESGTLGVKKISGNLSIAAISDPTYVGYF